MRPNIDQSQEEPQGKNDYQVAPSAPITMNWRSQSIFWMPDANASPSTVPAFLLNAVTYRPLEYAPSTTR